LELKLKTISPEAIPDAITTAEHFRALNEPAEAESICRDILVVDPENQAAKRLLGMALSDQFTGRERDAYNEAEHVLASLSDDYERFYFLGRLRECRSNAELRVGHAPSMVTDLLRDAL